VHRETLVIQLQHTDAYGRLFYPHQTAFCHGVFQSWLAARGLPLAIDAAHADHVAVVVHLESDYHAVLRLGDTVTAVFTVEAVGTTSFTYHLAFTRGDGVPTGTCRVVMVTVDPQSGDKIPLPPRLRAALETDRAAGG
jgi:acyl-CoA thioesterase FadM